MRISLLWPGWPCQCETNAKALLALQGQGSAFFRGEQADRTVWGFGHHVEKGGLQRPDSRAVTERDSIPQARRAGLV